MKTIIVIILAIVVVCEMVVWQFRNGHSSPKIKLLCDLWEWADSPTEKNGKGMSVVLILLTLIIR